MMIKVLEHTFFAQNCDIMITVSETNSLHKLWHDSSACKFTVFFNQIEKKQK